MDIHNRSFLENAEMTVRAFPQSQQNTLDMHNDKLSPTFDYRIILQDRDENLPLNFWEFLACIYAQFGTINGGSDPGEIAAAMEFIWNYVSGEEVLEASF